MVTVPTDPEALARACADFMWASDHASQSLGMVLESVTPGRSRLSMVVRPDMVNGHDLCHGGLIAALADSAFAFACNSHGRSRSLGRPILEEER